MSHDSTTLFANKILDLVLEDAKFRDDLTEGTIEESANALESILTSLALVSARFSAVHLGRLCEAGVPMKEVMEISDEVSEVLNDIFNEALVEQLVLVTDNLKETATKVKPTSH